jgi:hypothetical protein
MPACGSGVGSAFQRQVVTGRRESITARQTGSLRALPFDADVLNNAVAAKRAAAGGTAPTWMPAIMDDVAFSS